LKNQNTNISPAKGNDSMLTNEDQELTSVDERVSQNPQSEDSTPQKRENKKSETLEVPLGAFSPFR
jgi:hypothetical protein